jgi:hypothetical protein
VLTGASKKLVARDEVDHNRIASQKHQNIIMPIEGWRSMPVHDRVGSQLESSEN